MILYIVNYRLDYQLNVLGLSQTTKTHDESFKHPLICFISDFGCKSKGESGEYKGLIIGFKFNYFLQSISSFAIETTNKALETRLATLKAALVRRKRQCCSACQSGGGCGCGGCSQIIALPLQQCVQVKVVKSSKINIFILLAVYANVH